jgi:glycosyltransferase involved in cell wall biosynthesis
VPRSSKPAFRGPSVYRPGRLTARRVETRQPASEQPPLAVPFQGRGARPANLNRSYLISRTAFVSTYSPRQCGIATFTYDLATTVGEREIVALHPTGEVGPYPAEVRHRIRRDTQADYTAAANALNDCGVKVVSLQHGDGLWGGEEGSFVLDFIRALDVPLVVTLHHVPAQPSPAQRAILTELVDSAEATIVMSQAAVAEMTRSYGVPADCLQIVPHGVPHLPQVAADTIKPRVGLQGRAVILSFGLLEPGKGCEAVIDAMPQVIKAEPSACYVIMGATEPNLLARDGDTYRAGLEARVAARGVGQNVKFVDRFVGRVELGNWLEAADVITTPYPDLDRTVAATLSYAMAAGKAIVSTPYAYALEMLSPDRGRLVPAGSPEALAGAFIELLADPELRASMGRRAYDHSRGMVWWEIGSQYRRIFDRAISAAASAPRMPARKFAAVVA